MEDNEREFLVYQVAKAIRDAEHAEGHCDEVDTYLSYLPAARAATSVCLSHLSTSGRRLMVVPDVVGDF